MASLNSQRAGGAPVAGGHLPGRPGATARIGGRRPPQGSSGPPGPQGHKNTRISHSGSKAHYRIMLCKILMSM